MNKIIYFALPFYLIIFHIYKIETTEIYLN